MIICQISDVKLCLKEVMKVNNTQEIQVMHVAVLIETGSYDVQIGRYYRTKFRS
jgi:hypothetical protein